MTCAFWDEQRRSAPRGAELGSRCIVPAHRRFLRPPGPLFRRASGIRVPAQPSFREELYRARELRGDWAFGEQIIQIADDSANDYRIAANGRTVPDKELVLRSKIRIEARQFHMSRLHPQQVGREANH